MSKKAPSTVLTPAYCLSDELHEGEAVVRMTYDDEGMKGELTVLAYANYEDEKFGVIKMVGADGFQNEYLPDHLNFTVFTSLTDTNDHYHQHWTGNNGSLIDRDTIPIDQHVVNWNRMVGANLGSEFTANYYFFFGMLKERVRTLSGEEKALADAVLGEMTTWAFKK